MAAGKPSCYIEYCRYIFLIECALPPARADSHLRPPAATRCPAAPPAACCPPGSLPPYILLKIWLSHLTTFPVAVFYFTVSSFL